MSSPQEPKESGWKDKDEKRDNNCGSGGGGGGGGKGLLRGFGEFLKTGGVHGSCGSRGEESSSAAGTAEGQDDKKTKSRRHSIGYRDLNVLAPSSF